MQSSEATRFLLVCAGGAVGTGARFLLSTYSLARFGSDFPYGTLAVNVVGSLLLGIVMQLALTTDLVSPTVRLTLSVGVMGGFTTYSTFNYDTLRYAQEGAWGRALTYVLLTLLGCMLAGIVGVVIARRIAGG